MSAVAVIFTYLEKLAKSMGGPQSFKSQLLSILACHGHTSQHLRILVSTSIKALSVVAYFFPTMSFSIPHRTTSQHTTAAFCELEPRHACHVYTYELYLHRASIYRAPIYTTAVHRGPIYSASVHRGPIYGASIYRGPVHRGPIYKGPLYIGVLYI